MKTVIQKIFHRLFDNAKKNPIVLNVSYKEETGLLEGKRAIIIGGTTGIGQAIAHKLHCSGCEVIVASRNPQKQTEHFKVEKWDVSEIEKIPQYFKDIIEKYDKIDIIINSQGICPLKDFEQNFGEIRPKDFEEVMGVNLESVFFICQEACKYFRANNIKGHILNIASTEGLKGAVVPYGISKAGIVSLTKGLGKKMISSGVVINGIAPGATTTSMMKMDANVDIRRDYIPSQRASIVEEIANVALLLISDMGNNMPGTIITVDGGESLH